MGASVDERAAPAEDVTLIALVGPDRGQLARVPREGGVVGREDGVAIRLGDPGLSPKHARFERDPGGRLWVRDLGSRYGMFVDGEKRTEAPLLDGTRLQLSGESLLRVRFFPKREGLPAGPEASRDELTGLAGRRYLLDRLEQELTFARRHRASFSLLLLDLDLFTRLVAEHGAPIQDELLRGVGKSLAQAVRVEDLVARYGFDEFAVLVRGYDEGGARGLGERLGRLLRERPVRAGGQSFHLTASVGVVGYQRGETDSVLGMAARADAAMHLAKHRGRDQVAAWKRDG